MPSTDKPHAEPDCSVMSARSLSVALLAMVVGACRESAGVVERESRPLTLCIPPLTVLAETGSAGPRFTWSPRCGATYIEVTSPDHQEVFWIVQGDTGKVAPGVTYGVNPPAYETRFGPHPLVPGTRYVVRVGVMVEENSFFIVGEGDFTR